MIDFRYHIVSIVSIFFALAVGIVLGAGPLQANLGAALGDQVSSLRAERADLAEKLKTAEAQVSADDSWSDATRDRIVAGTLKGESVVLVVLPSAGSDLVSNTRDSLTAAGASISGTVEITDDWFDATKSGERATAATAAGSRLQSVPTGTDDAKLAKVLAVAVSRTDSPAAVTSPEARVAALGDLHDANLLNTSGDLEPAKTVVIISGPYSGTDQVVGARSEVVRLLVNTFADDAQATIVITADPVTAAGQPATSDAVKAVREDRSLAGVVSTVDHAATGRGPAVVALAAAAQNQRIVGHYGVGTGATAIFPPVPAPEPATP